MLRERPPRRLFDGRLLILAASVLWGTTGTSQALAPPGAQPVGIATVRVALGGAVLVLAASRLRSLRSGVPVAAVMIAAASLVIAQLCFFAAVDRTGVAIGTAVAIGTSPIVAGALAWVLRGERLGARWVAATALSVAGCTLLLTTGRTVAVDAIGVGLALIVGVGYAGYTLATKAIVDRHPPEVAIGAVFGVSAVCMAPLLFFVRLDWVLHPTGAFIAAHLALVTVALAYTMFARGLRTVAGPTAVTLTLAEPLTAALLGVAVLRERLTAPAIAGVVLVLAGLTLLTAGSPRR
jgi:DME family drug/metabolite transporter